MRVPSTERSEVRGQGQLQEMSLETHKTFSEPISSQQLGTFQLSSCVYVLLCERFLHVYTHIFMMLFGL